MPTSGAFERIQFVYEYAEGYRTYATNGMVGGLTPKGELRVDFYIEGFSTPTSVTHTLKPDGQLGSEVAREPSSDPSTALVTRKIQMALLIPGSQIEAFALFLSQKANELKGLMKGQDDATTDSAAVR